MSETKRDLYFVEFFVPGKFYHFLEPPDGMPTDWDGRSSIIDDDNVTGRQELLDWLGTNLPETRWEPLAPPERSGMISGGIDGRICIHFDKDSLAKFSERWERDDRSIDPRFQLAWISYDTWMKGYPGPPSYDDL